MRVKPVETGHVCQTVGYGLTSANGTRNSKILMTVDLPIVSKTVCAVEYLLQEVDLTDTMICAGYQFGGKDTCSVSSVPDIVAIIKVCNF